MDHITIPDLTKSPPRQGRDLLGGRYAWLARLADKVRAQHAGTNGDYIAYCQLSKAYLATIGISEKQFDDLIDEGAGDEQLVRFFDEHVDERHREAANALVLRENADSLERQDAEEGYARGPD
jgi:hypothetical protein